MKWKTITATKITTKTRKVEEVELRPKIKRLPHLWYTYPAWRNVFFASFVLRGLVYTYGINKVNDLFLLVYTASISIASLILVLDFLGV